MSVAEDISDFERRARALVAERKGTPTKDVSPRRDTTGILGLFKGVLPKVTADHIKAFAVGLIGIFMVRVARFYAADTPLIDRGTDLYWGVDVMAGLAIAFVAPKLISIRCGSYVWWNAAGMAVSLTMMHNLVHYAPSAFSTLFSPQWVEQVMIDTTPNSVIFRNMVFDKHGTWAAEAPAAASAKSSCGAGDVSGALSGGSGLLENMSNIRGSCF